jgi:exosortase/archaeosortase family protein
MKPLLRLDPKQRSLWRSLNFLVRLIILALPLYLIIWLGIDLLPLQLAAASQSAWLLEVTGNQVLLEGTGLLVNNSFEFIIIPDCTGWKSMIFLFALIFAVPGADLRKRLLGLVGLPLIWVANLARVYGVVMVQGVWGTEAAVMMHDTLFQLGLIVLVFVVWIIWLLWSEGRLTLRVFSLRRP